jgi:F-box and WD-40 domain protein CDC4
MLMDELNVVSNLTSRKRFQTYNLVGHEKHITCLDIKGRLVVSGSHDTSVKVWDLQKKRGVSFDHHRGHINWVTQVMVWDDSSVLSAGADRTIRYWDLGQVEEQD